jgi:hypothetical protein
MNNRLLLLGAVAAFSIGNVSAQKSYAEALNKTNDFSEKQEWIKSDLIEEEAIRSMEINDESGYFYQNAYVMSGQSNNYDTDPLKVWVNGVAGGSSDTTITQAEQFVPNSVDLTLNAVSFLGMASNVSATAVVVIQSKSFEYITHEFVTVGGFDKYTAELTNPVNLTDSFFIVITPYSDADSLSVGVTNDYTGTLPYDGNGYFVEYNSGTFAFENVYTPGDGGGDWIVWPDVSYALGDVVADKECLNSENEVVTFTSPNEGAITNPVWNYNAWAVAQGAPISSGYYYSRLMIQESDHADTTQEIGYTHVFDAVELNTVQYFELIYPWGSATGPIEQETSIALDICTDVAENDDQAIQVFPNPASDFITFKVLSDEQSLSIYSVSGQLISVEKIKNNSITIDVTNMSNGYYFYQITGIKSDLISGRFVVSK